MWFLGKLDRTLLHLFGVRWCCNTTLLHDILLDINKEVILTSIRTIHNQRKHLIKPITNISLQQIIALVKRLAERRFLKRKMKDGLQKGSSIPSSQPKFSLNLVIPRVIFAIPRPMHTVNPLLSPPGAYLFQTHLRGA